MRFTQLAGLDANRPRGTARTLRAETLLKAVAKRPMPRSCAALRAERRPACGAAIRSGGFGLRDEKACNRGEGALPFEDSDGLGARAASPSTPAYSGGEV